MPTLELTIERLAKSGDGVAQHSGRAVFVSGAAPGERVSAEVIETGKALRGEIVEILSPGPDRRAPACPHARACGGCDWMHLTEAAQRREKQDIVTAALQHTGGLDRTRYRLAPLVASPKAQGSRRRATVHPVRGALGYFGRRSHSLVPVAECIALSGRLASLPGRLAAALGPVLKDIVELQLLEASDRAAIAVELKAQVRAKHRDLLEALIGSGELAGAVLLPGEGKGNVEIFGDPVLDEDGLRLRPDAFAQANVEVNRLLVAAAVDALDLGGAEAVLELYSGNGNFTFSLAPRASTVIAVESSSVSVLLAQQAARKRGLAGVRFMEGDAEKVAAGFMKESARFDRLLLDPPRTGAPGVGQWASRLLVSRVVYVACDPVALARDAAELVAQGYEPDTLQLFDLFPQTHHVEALMSFSRPAA